MHLLYGEGMPRKVSQRGAEHAKTVMVSKTTLTERPRDGLASSPTDMRISVHIYAYLRYYLPAAEKSVQGTEWDMPAGSTVTRVPGECVRVT